MARELCSYRVRQVSLCFGRYDRRFRHKTGHFPNYKNPKAFSEKLAWMRLYDRNPLYVTLVDKVAVREYVRERVGEDVLIPLYGTWANAKDIDFAALPRRFVLKCSHDSGFVVICKNKEQLDISYVRAQLAARLKMNHYYRHHEWPYLHVEPRVICEELLMGENEGPPSECSIHCFGGEIGYILKTVGRHSDSLRGYYSRDWEKLPFDQANGPITDFPRPPYLERLLQMARALAKGLRYGRVDFYEARGKLYFSEIDLCPRAGLIRYIPSSYDRYWGDRLPLPEVDSHE